MSWTEIYAVKEGEESMRIGECRNAFRGAMYVWNDIAKRYFDLECFPHFDQAMQRRVWNACDEKPLTKIEEIVLASTMDRATVKKENISQLLAAFKEYGKAHESSSISEQAEILEQNLKDIPEGWSIAWIQTSVCDGWFHEFDNETEESICDLKNSWDVIGQIAEAV